MTTFQGVVVAIVQGFTEFLPVSAEAHRWMLDFFFGWTVPGGVVSGTLALGALLALLITFRHDWASMISSLLEVALLWRKPMTLDQRMPIFIVLSCAPVALAWRYLSEAISAIPVTPLLMAAALVLPGIPLWLADSMNRRTKNLFSWNALDALVVGLTQVLTLIPGTGRQIWAFTAAFGRNYEREAATKFVFFSLAPILAFRAAHGLSGLDFSAPEPAPEVSWLTLGVTAVVTCLAGCFAIGGFVRSIAGRRITGFVLYRLVLAAGIGIVYWLRD